MRLYECSKEYIIPYIQLLAMRQALILYNSYESDNAHEEAKSMHDSLEKAGFQATTKHWSDTLDFPKFIGELREEKEGISVLFSSIMAHGSAGMLLLLGQIYKCIQIDLYPDLTK